MRRPYRRRLGESVRATKGGATRKGKQSTKPSMRSRSAAKPTAGGAGVSIGRAFEVTFRLSSCVDN